ncbi:outer membrane protein assembly factor BamB family protein [Nannocystis radixulma]|uniref:PQQ-binding-like beta-propeller repeat protein n=1 Tax=Nannocystis radixulma TaxID=2995305 RepID=A0ABT5BI09_9BACT|nr:PQQ-binding-like beta-propeller repeat protein [Nannocystis radixulma]MDC0673737.1 PQQ-binding-like beta-propeller repeat protein [Nannocystis radixulma]
MQFAAPTTVLITLALAGCVPSIVVGDNPQDTSSPESTTGGSTDATPTSSASSDESEPGVCGDGVVDAGESCDDGNDESNDGCDGACQRSGRVVWTIELAGIDAVTDLDVDPAGRILVNGWGGDTAHLLAFAPDGTELWRRTIADPGELAIDASGRIFIAGIAGTLQAFSPEMKSLWSLDIDGGFAGLALGPDAVYSAAHSGEETVQVTVRRHDPATGEIVWESSTPPMQSALCDDLAVIGEQVVSVGKLHPELDGGVALVAAFDPDGAHPWAEQFPGAATQWTGAAPVGESELVIAGNSPDNNFVLRRLGPDNELIWTSHLADAPGSWPLRVAVGPGEQIAVVGGDLPGDNESVVRLHDAAGVLLWSSVLEKPEDVQDDRAVAAAFSADALFVAGNFFSGVDEDNINQAWLRRFALD